MPLDTAGIYPAPLERPLFVQCPIVNGYTTARLYAPYSFAGSTPIFPTLDHKVTGLIENTGDIAAAIAINQTGTEWVTGTRKDNGKSFAAFKCQECGKWQPEAKK